MAEQYLNVNRELNNMNCQVSAINYCTAKVREVASIVSLFKSVKYYNFLLIGMGLYTIVTVALQLMGKDSLYTPVECVGVVLAVAAFVLLKMTNHNLGLIGSLLISATVIMIILSLVFKIVFLPIIGLGVLLAYGIYVNLTLNKNINSISKSI